VTGVTKEVLAEVRSRANIVDEVAESVVLKRAGGQYRGLCPFHKEKTPSFNVSAEKGIFKCYGCGEGGDVFAFVQKIRGFSFIDAVRYLANKYGVQLVESVEQREEQDKRAMIRSLYEETCLYFQSLLAHPDEGYIAREYLAARGMDQSTIEKFRMGYAPNAWDGLLTYLTRKMSVSQQLLEEAGLVRQKQGGTSYYDLFRHRLMVPICDGEGRVIAFGGRTLGDDQVKYINSPESPIYKKGEHLFAFNLAKEAIRKNDSVIVVEGYFDAITPHQYGFTNTVATLGTAMTEAQARLLIRYTESKRVYLSFDSDAAGQKAVERGVETLSQIAEGVGIELRIIRIPGGKDPDECLRATEPPGGVEGFTRALETAPLITDWQIEDAIKGIEVRSHTGRIEASKRVIPIVGRIKSAAARVEYVRQCASLLNIREEELLVDVRQFRKDQRLDTDVRNSPFQPQNGQGFQGKGGNGFQKGGNGFQKGGGGKGGRGNFKGKEEQEGAPLTRRSREIAGHGLMNAERQLLAHYLVSRDDLEMVSNALGDWTLLTPEHQEIKSAIEGIGTQFNTMEDLQYKLMDRLAGLEDLRTPLTEIILKVEEIRKQNLPVSVVISDYKGKILLERLTSVINKMRQLLGMTNDDAAARDIMTKISELNQLNKVELLSAKTLEDLDDLKRKIEAVETAYKL
jgi:DNA primase catalytic core